MNEEQGASGFVDFVSYKQMNVVPKGVNGSLIKANMVACTGVRAIAVNIADDEQPTIITHSEDDVIVAVEFQCKCGCSATIGLDYVHEQRS